MQRRSVGIGLLAASLITVGIWIVIVFSSIPESNILWAQPTLTNGSGTYFVAPKIFAYPWQFFEAGIATGILFSAGVLLILILFARPSKAKRD